MIIIMPKTHEQEEPERPKDWAFMEQSGKVLANIPDTWKAYADDIPGKMGIINMEHAELMRATTLEDKMRECMHLASACLYLWRSLADVK